MNYNIDKTKNKGEIIMKKMDDVKQKFGVDQMYFYYCRNTENKPVIAVCIIRRGDEYARGVAICSPSDIPMKKTGRKIARDRALKALYTADDFDRIARDEALQVLDDIEVDNYTEFTYKGEFMPEFTTFEKRLFGLIERNMN